jgi:hypothetical protein
LAIVLVALARAPAATDPPAPCAAVDVAPSAQLVAQLLEHAPIACICESCTLLSDPGSGRFAAAGHGVLVVRPTAMRPTPRRPEVRLLCPQKVPWREDR